MYVIILAVFTT